MAESITSLSEEQQVSLVVARLEACKKTHDPFVRYFERMERAYRGLVNPQSKLATLQALFAILLPDGSPNPRVNFGYYFQDADGAPAGSFPWSDVFDAVRDVDGVAKVDAGPTGLLLNGARADLPLSALQFPLLGTVTVVDGASGQPF